MLPDPLPSAERAGYDLVCSNAAARLILETWLDSSALSWPGRFRLTVQVGESNPFPPDDRLVLRQPTVSIQAGPSADTVRIEWELAPAVAEVHPSRPEATLWLSPEALTQLELAERTFLLVILVFLLRRRGVVSRARCGACGPGGSRVADCRRFKLREVHHFGTSGDPWLGNRNRRHRIPDAPRCQDCRTRGAFADCPPPRRSRPVGSSRRTCHGTAR